MKRFWKLLFIVLLLTPILCYGAVTNEWKLVNVTSANTTTTFDEPMTILTFVNDGTADVYIELNGVAGVPSSTSTGYLKSSESLSLSLNVGGRLYGIKSFGAITSGSTTATLRVFGTGF